MEECEDQGSYSKNINMNNINIFENNIGNFPKKSLRKYKKDLSENCSSFNGNLDCDNETYSYNVETSKSSIEIENHSVNTTEYNFSDTDCYSSNNDLNKEILNSDFIKEYSLTTIGVNKFQSLNHSNNSMDNIDEVVAKDCSNLKEGLDIYNVEHSAKYVSDIRIENGCIITNPYNLLKEDSIDKGLSETILSEDFVVKCDVIAKDVNQSKSLDYQISCVDNNDLIVKEFHENCDESENVVNSINNSTTFFKYQHFDSSNKPNLDITETHDNDVCSTDLNDTLTRINNILSEKTYSQATNKNKKSQNTSDKMLEDSINTNKFLCPINIKKFKNKKNNFNHVGSPVATYIRTNQKITSNSKIPKATLTSVSTPISKENQKFKYLPSPVGMYIKNSPRVALLKNVKCCTDNNIQLKYDASVKRNNFIVRDQSFPSIIYKPSKKVEQQTVNSISLPNKIKAVLPSIPTTTQHKHYISNPGRDIQNKILQDNLTCEDSLLNDTTDISLHIVKKAYIK